MCIIVEYELVHRRLWRFTTESSTDELLYKARYLGVGSRAELHDACSSRCDLRNPFMRSVRSSSITFYRARV